jgi:hypothetical protein
VRFAKKTQRRRMDNHTYGEIFEREAPRLRRSSRSSTQFRQSYNEDLIAPSIGEVDDGDAHRSTFSCTEFMRDSRIYDYFLLLVSRVGLTIYMNDESNQYALLTKIFVESFAFNNSMSRPTVSFKIYNKPTTMSLSKFYGILGIEMTGTSKRIKDTPADLLELY